MREWTPPQKEEDRNMNKVRTEYDAKCFKTREATVFGHVFVRVFASYVGVEVAKRFPQLPTTQRAVGCLYWGSVPLTGPSVESIPTTGLKLFFAPDEIWRFHPPPFHTPPTFTGPKTHLKSRNAKKTTRLDELFREVRANFCLRPCDTSQECKGNCSEKLVLLKLFNRRSRALRP